MLERFRIEEVQENDRTFQAVVPVRPVSRCAPRPVPGGAIFLSFQDEVRMADWMTAENFADQRGSALLFYPDGNIRTLHQIEGDIFRLAVANYGGCVTSVARHLGIGRSTVYRKLDQFGIRCPD